MVSKTERCQLQNSEHIYIDLRYAVMYTFLMPIEASGTPKFNWNRAHDVINNCLQNLIY